VPTLVDDHSKNVHETRRPANVTISLIDSSTRSTLHIDLLSPPFQTFLLTLLLSELEPESFLICLRRHV
jgi:hypothetical protein